MCNGHYFTVFTPTFNRKNLLKNVYSNLKNQTFDDFEWLIIDDGSTDGTEFEVEKWIAEGELEIVYVKKENGGKHTAFKLAYEMCRTPYIVDFDDDDIYMPNCLEIFYKAWTDIENSHRQDIGSIKALTITPSGRVLGGKCSVLTDSFLDTNYIDYQVIQGRDFENVTSTKMSCYKLCPFFYFDKYWYNHKITFVYEDVFWARFAREYNTRYIFSPVRIYQYSDNSITRGRQNYSNRWYSAAYSNKIFIQENLFLFKCSFFYMFRRYILYLTYIITLKLPYNEALKELRCKTLWLLGYGIFPIILVLSLYLKYFRHNDRI